MCVCSPSEYITSVLDPTKCLQIKWAESIPYRVSLKEDEDTYVG